MTEIPNWHITGGWFDNCSCAVACPCTFAQAPDNGFCQSVLSWHIRSGHHGHINLDGLSFVRVGRWEGDLWPERSREPPVFFIDDHADERQAEVLPRIFGGHAGGFPALVASLFTEGRQPGGGGARADHFRNCARPRSVGNRDRRQSEGLGQGADGSNKAYRENIRTRLALRPAWDSLLPG
jgi:Protein of unknown function (DUF1326)